MPLRRSRLTFGAALVATAAILAACSPGSSATIAAVSSTSPTPASDTAPREIAVTLTDALEIEPSSITVPSGERIRFLVTNRGSTDHEFYVGDMTAQMAHDREMAGMPGMTHDEPAGIGVKPGQTKTLEYSFLKPGSYQAACHVNGHFEGGMVAAITVEP